MIRFQKYKNLIFLAYISGTILLVTLQLNNAKELNNITILQLRGDYFFHILLFLPWMFFKDVFRFKQLIWLLTGLLFASASEGLQYLLPYRAYNLNDLLANMLGVIIGALLIPFFLLILSHKSKNQL